MSHLCYWDSSALTRLFYKVKSVRNDATLVGWGCNGGQENRNDGNYKAANVKKKGKSGKKVEISAISYTFK